MFSFFGDQNGKQTPVKTKTIVSKVSVTKSVTRPSASIPATNNTGSPNVSKNPSSSLLKAPSSTPKKGSSPSRPSSSSGTHSSTSGSRPTSSSAKVPSSNLEVRLSPQPKQKSISSSRSPALKRKTSTVARIESESESDSSSSSSESSDDALDPKPKKRRKGITNGSATPLAAGLGDEDHARKDQWCLDQVDMRGEYGRGWVGFVGSEEVVRGQIYGWAGGNGGNGDGKNLEKYQAYFPQPGFEHGDKVPEVELLYPATGCKEKFILLTPTSAREYNPISELRTALRHILDRKCFHQFRRHKMSPSLTIECATCPDYIPPAHSHIFGTLSENLTDPLESASIVPSRITSPLPGHSALATPPPDQATPSETIGDALRKALAPNRRDGPGFLKAMKRFNRAMEEIQRDGSLKEWMSTRPGLRGRDWASLVDFVHDQAYSRCVGPYSNELEVAISGKEDAYGELRHSFMSKVIEQTKLGPDSVFVDLGSGVGNCVLQTALQAGSKSYGFELLPVPAHCARLQLREVQRRWAMWGLNGNLEVKVHEGDFRTHPMVAKRLREADVVLVNNEVFPSSLNIDLTNMFLDLKEGAIIVSLKPFVAEGFRMNESNCDSFSAIVKSTQHSYYRDWVSWKGDSGRYYLQVIDRSKRAKFEEDLMSGRRSRR
ncbi:histone-lysine N-methyltransferase, H3 lysine-79 specific [Kwoniella heveanensis CBS 569]|nr:histone-lysine N-methyltransferase, H3 lysine-79 specific [Kwoniella heveanensis CBS 569]